MRATSLLRLFDAVASRPSWLAFAAFCIVAVLRASLASPPPSLIPANDAARRDIFSSLAASEDGFRSRAALNFPGDPWSQDDDFHAHEMQLAQRQAAAHQTSLGAALRAFDDGAREKWPSPSRDAMKNTVPPCRPRPVY